MTTPPEEQASSSSGQPVQNAVEMDTQNNEENGGDVVEGQEGDGDGNEGGGKSRQRPRKRKIYASICRQMEFYFSDANITKNRLMQEMVMSGEFIELSIFLEFNRIKKMTTREEDLQKALAKSEKLILSPDLSGVKRKVQYDPKKVKSDAEVEDCTIYVENVPRHVDHAWLETIFLSFGPIAYISLPKFRSNNQPKGFAFVEFDNAESANGCLEAYKGEGACLPTDMNPAELMSIQTFNEEQEAVQKKNGKTEIVDKSPTRLSPKKRKGDGGGGSSTPENPKRIKLEDQNPANVGSSPQDTQETTNKGEEHLAAEEGGGSSKRKRKRKKKKTDKTAEEKLEGDAIYLKVMPKKSWRQLRNRYLNLQRQNMSKLKKQLRDQYLREQHYKNCAPRNDDPGLQKSHIIEIFMDTPAESVEAFKKQIKVDLAGESEEEAAISGFVKYVDYEEGAIQAYVRFGEDESFTARISNFVTNAEKVFRSARSLTVHEALEYKTHVQEALKQKRKQLPRNKVRGKDRLLKAAAKSACHIRFDDKEPVSENKDEAQNEVTGNDMEFSDGERENQSDDRSMDEPESTTA